VGKYALIQFISQDVFSNHPMKPLYGKTYPGFCINDNCDLVRGWPNKTAMIGNAVIPANFENLWATNGNVSVNTFLSPVVGIQDVGNSIPVTFFFAKGMARFFVNEWNT